MAEPFKVPASTGDGRRRKPVARRRLQPDRATGGDSYGDIAFAPDGSFYVLDVGNRRVQRFDRPPQPARDLGCMVTTSNRWPLTWTRPASSTCSTSRAMSWSDMPPTARSSGRSSRHLDAYAADDMKVDSQGAVYVSANINNPNGNYRYSGDKLDARCRPRLVARISTTGWTSTVRAECSSHGVEPASDYPATIEVVSGDGNLYFTGFGSVGKGDAAVRIWVPDDRGPDRDGKGRDMRSDDAARPTVREASAFHAGIVYIAAEATTGPDELPWSTSHQTNSRPGGCAWSLPEASFAGAPAGPMPN